MFPTSLRYAFVTVLISIYIGSLCFKKSTCLVIWHFGISRIFISVYFVFGLVFQGRHLSIVTPH